MTSYCRAPLNFIAHARPTVGDTKMSVIANDHLGWLNCDGRTLNVNDFYLLWRVIGYSFGGSGQTFRLPNAAGRVTGVVGQGTDANLSTFTVALGASVGEYIHTLTIAEMPSHNHGVNGSDQSSYNTSTSAVTTGILVLNSTTQITADQDSHSHSYIRPSGTSGTSEYNGFGSINVLSGTVGDTTGTADPLITVTNPPHRHDIFDPTHAHTLHAAGGDRPHNNVQPMIGLGNMFMFCGINNYPSSAAIPFNGFPYLSNSQIL